MNLTNSGETMETTTEFRRLTKSRTDRMIDGVCGGIAAYAGVDATLVRLAWVLITLLGGSGILLYIAAMILIPKEKPAPGAVVPEPPATGVEPPKPSSKANGTNTKFWGILLVGVGAFWLASNLGFHFWHHWWGLSLGVAIPVLLILAGVAFLFGGRNYVSSTSVDNPMQPEAAGGSPGGPSAAKQTRLTKSRTDKKIAGVCGGIGNFVQIDPVVVRLGFVLAGLASAGIMIILYVILAIVLPSEPERTPEPAGAGI